jgi:hypothetical protein
VSVRINAIPARTGLLSRWDVVKVLEVFIGLRLGGDSGMACKLKYVLERLGTVDIQPQDEYYDKKS